MKKGLLLASLFLLIPLLSKATPFYGVNLSYPAFAKTPENLHGIQGFASYDPGNIRWKQLNVYFDAGVSQFWINRLPYYTTLTIYSIAPIVRYTFSKTKYLTPFAELSVGLSYLNHTRLDSRNLGIHFAFQDRLGVGALFGERFSVGLHALHYSNAHLSSHNSGITIPLVIDIGYRFN